MLIFEGPDGAGKTTLIQQFTENFDLEVAPRVVSKEAQAMTDLQVWVDRNLDMGFQYKIFDRHRLISESIYGPVLRHHQSTGFNDLTWMGPRIRRFYDIKPIIIYCLPPLQVVINNIKNDGDNAVVQEHIEAIYTAYVAKAAMDHAHYRGSVHVWDYTRSPQVKGRPGFFYDVHQEMRERAQ